MISELNGKLKTLRFRINKTDEIIDKHDKEVSERHQASIANITSAVNTLKESIEEKKFSKGETEEQVTEWGADAESMLAEADECTRKIAKQNYQEHESCCTRRRCLTSPPQSHRA